MLIFVRHITRYAYAEPVRYAIQVLRLTPPSFLGQRVVDWRVRVAGAGPALPFRDGFGNHVQLITINTLHQALTVEAVGSVETMDRNGVVEGLDEPSPARVYLRETPHTRPEAPIRELAGSVAVGDSLGRLHALAAAVRDAVDHVPGTTDAHTSAAQALADGKGVCQDHAHIFIAAARQAGVPARYVTGYLFLDDPDHAVAHHAWAETWVAGLGWVGFDAANGVCPTEHYVRLAAALDARYAAPIRGMHRGGVGESLAVEVKVQQAGQQQ